MKKYNFYTIVIFILLSGCKVTDKINKDDLVGSYTNNNRINNFINLSKRNFSIIDTGNRGHIASFICCDTISKGEWEFLNNDRLLSFSTSEFLGTQNSGNLPYYIKESNSKSKDSFYFKINTPINDFLGGISYDLIYSFNIRENYAGVFANYFSENPEFICKRAFNKDIKLLINIYPKYDYGGRNLGTRKISFKDFNFQNKEVNTFEINIPDLTYEYLTYLRFNKEFIRVINKDHLEWHGHIYVRKKKGA